MLQYAWCAENKLIFTGHILHEDSLSIQTLFQGSIQRFYEYMDYPGVDILTEGNRAYWVAKQVQSAARQTGKKFVLSELYGCTGWQFNFRSHRDVGAWQTMLGISLRCHHLSWYTMEGEAKRDYPASIFYQSAWYKDYKYVEDYFARLGEIVNTGTPLCEVLVINPVESVWLYPRAGWEKNAFEVQVPHVVELEKNYVELFNILTTGQVGAHVLKLKYVFYADALPDTDYKFVLEQSERWQVSVNGNKLADTVVGHWIDLCFDEIDLPRSYLKIGQNVLEMTAEFDESLNLECAYILGIFGVGLNDRKTVIRELPEKLATGDIVGQGLPFYSGKILYHTGIRDRRLQVALDGCCGAVSKAVSDSYSEYIAFAPYESKIFDCKGELKIEVCMTRRNTFGPLHYAPVLCSAYGPELFVQGGADYTDDYCLIKQGVSEKISVKLY